jgi:hypothetical protein
LTSTGPILWKAFWSAVGMPMLTVFVDALAVAGIASTATPAAAIAALMRCDKGAPLGRIYVICRYFALARDLRAST